ncbi:putative protease Do-like 9-like [Capsicum annuum]|nr:putative protease Do-like 9-like [Capsicum annuum]KAF3682169.1 putative protease Do-like 9-like [Capsicum annuum]
MVGCLGNLHESLEKLDNMYIQPNKEKDILLKPKPAACDTSVPLLSITNSPSERQFYKCPNHNGYVTDYPQTRCPNAEYNRTCGCTVNTNMTYVASPAKNVVASDGGLVKGVVTYMVLDDLVVNPMSTISSITLLNEFCVKDVGVLKEKVATLGMDELSLAASRLDDENMLADSDTASAPSAEIQNFKLFVSSWNVGGIAPPNDLNMEDLIDTENDLADIYVFGFQEIVPLSAGSVIVPENTTICMQWNSLIRKALNKIADNDITLQMTEEEDILKVYPLKKGSSLKFTMENSTQFECIISKQMVGIFITIWVRSPLLPYISHTSVSCVGCGIFGYLGNKGSVSVRFWLHETSFCFVCSHLASGGKDGDERQRNADASQILSRTRFPCDSFQYLPRKILQHDKAIWLGDLNYRIYLPEATTRSLVNDGQWSILLQKDQLKAELREGCIFNGWQEEEIEFAPTYKYNPDSDDYYGCSQNGKRGKNRAPACLGEQSYMVLVVGGRSQVEGLRGISREKMTNESQMQDVATTVGVTSIASISRANAPQPMAPAKKPEKFAGSLIVNDAFQVAAIIEKLPPIWKDFKNYLKHKHKEMTVKDFIVRLRNEEDNKATERRMQLGGNLGEWLMDSGATRHVCANKELFSSFALAQVEEMIYMANSATVKVEGT